MIYWRYPVLHRASKMVAFGHSVQQDKLTLYIMNCLGKTKIYVCRMRLHQCSLNWLCIQTRICEIQWIVFYHTCFTLMHESEGINVGLVMYWIVRKKVNIYWYFTSGLGLLFQQDVEIHHQYKNFTICHCHSCWLFGDPMGADINRCDINPEYFRSSA